MSEFDAGDWEPQFAERALKNLEVIDNGGVNNVTQIVLTLFAIVVVQQENQQFDKIDNIGFDEMVASGWPVEGWTWEVRNNSKDIKTFLKMLRNAIAHGDFYFIAESGKISTIGFGNVKRSARFICGTWTVEQAYKACRKILEVIQENNKN